MRRYFVDTFYSVALSNRRDQWHQCTVMYSQLLVWYYLYTVDEVLAEFLAVCSTSGPGFRARAVYAVRNAGRALGNTAWLAR
jgi:hypothetical protein